jgi:hypothetical protein
MLVEKFKGAIREWIGISIKTNYSPIAGGFSGAGVYFVPFRLSFPGLSQLPLELDVVIKLDSKHGFALDKQNYDNIAKIPNLQKYFAAFSSLPRQIGEDFFMVMEFLGGYRRLQDLLYSETKEMAVEHCNAVLEAMREIQINEGGKVEKGPSRILSSMYFGDIEKNLNKIAEENSALAGLFSKSQLLPDQQSNPHRKMSLLECLSCLWKKHENLEPKFCTRMHGDCHSRNIMFNSSGSPRVKFIDIDQFSFKGDYIYDFGELISDLEVVSYLQNQICFSLPSNQFEYQLELPEAVTAAIETIWKEVENELQQDDPHWKSRLYLAKARYLFSVVANSSQFKNDFPLAFVTFCEGLRELQNAMDAI